MCGRWRRCASSAVWLQNEKRGWNEITARLTGVGSVAGLAGAQRGYRVAVHGEEVGVVAMACSSLGSWMKRSTTGLLLAVQLGGVQLQAVRLVVRCSFA
jgi:hypothetical protein